jgi:hypothetical protein
MTLGVGEIFWFISHTPSVILPLDESESSVPNKWYQSRSILQPKHLLLIPFLRLPQSSADSRNTGCPCSSLLSCTDKQQLV